jgi:hypothetical protein
VVIARPEALLFVGAKIIRRIIQWSWHGRRRCHFLGEQRIQWQSHRGWCWRFCSNAEFRGHGNKAGGADIFGVNKGFSGYGMARGTDSFASKEFSCNGEANFLILPTNDFLGSGDNLLPCDLGRFPSWGLGGMILEVIKMVKEDGAMLSIQAFN